MTRLVIILLAAVLVLGACETTKGVGKDLQKAGEWIENKASK